MGHCDLGPEDPSGKPTICPSVLHIPLTNVGEAKGHCLTRATKGRPLSQRTWSKWAAGGGGGGGHTVVP